VLLFTGYLRVSWTVAATADGAAQALQARDMLAGNWLLHGWTVSDVSFYTTELPEYVLVELVRPLGTGVIHVAAAATYTLLVLGVFLLARGRVRGRAGLLCGALAAGIMLAPQLGYGSFVLLLSPDHVGTQVPLLLGWLLLDRARPAPAEAPPPSRTHQASGGGLLHAHQVNAARLYRGHQVSRWGRPVVLCLLLAWVQFADRIALLTAVLPLVIVCAVTAARTGAPSTRRSRVPAKPPLSISFGAPNPDKTVDQMTGTDRKWAGEAGIDRKWDPQDASGRPPGRRRTGERMAAGQMAGGREAGWWRGGGFAGALALAGVASVGVSWAGARLLAAAGGFAARPFPFTLAPPGLLWTHTWLTGWGILELYGANFLGVSGWTGFTFAALHLAGLALAIAGTGIALRRFPWPRQAERADADLVDSVLAVAVVANLLSYVLSIEPGTVLGTGYDAREIAAVLPFGAVLAGRIFGPRLARRTRLDHGRGRAEKRARSGVGVLLGLVFWLGLAGYASALGYSAAQPGAAGPDAALADWLTGHGLRYGLGGASANSVTLDSAGRTAVAGITVTKGRVQPLLYQSTAASYDPRLHDATFLVAGAPAAEAGDAPEAVPAAAVRATFGVPARVYRFDGFTVDVWDVNLLTRMRK
jgi:hypothetical protein